MTNDVDITKVGKKPGLDIWRIKEFRLEEVPKNEYGQFYTGDTYIVMHTKWNSWDIHFWIGSEASLDEIGTAAMKAVEIDQALDGMPVQYREVQNHESGLFLSHFPNGIRYLSGGYDSGFHKIEDMFANWKPKLFHCKGKRNVRCTQVVFKKESLNLGDVFLLDLGREIYVWMPPESGRLERIRGMARAKNIANHERVGQAKVHVLDSDWDTDETFWSHFGGLDAVKTIAKAKNDDEGYWKRTTEKVTLYRVSDASGAMKVTKVAQGEIKRSQLDSKDAFILDAIVGGVFVWIGKDCTMDERAQAMVMGSKYLKEKNLPTYTSVVRVLESAEPQSFIQWFGEWVDNKTKKVFEPRLFQVSDESGRMMVEEIANYDQESLDGDDVMILDALNIIYVWIGAGANQNEKKNAQQTAEKYLKFGNLPRHERTTIETIYQGKETPSFKKLFPNWDDELFQGEHRTVEQMRRHLFQ
uniref:Gelsolin repeat protein n=1 Tax=Haemonchus contortus TaxID=6289 RepID=A0A7I4Z1A8_HAECO